MGRKPNTKNARRPPLNPKQHPMPGDVANLSTLGKTLTAEGLITGNHTLYNWQREGDLLYWDGPGNQALVSEAWLREHIEHRRELSATGRGDSSTPDTRLIPRKKFAELTGLQESSIKQMVSAGKIAELSMGEARRYLADKAERTGEAPVSGGQGRRTQAGAAKERLATAQARKAEIELARMEGSLYPKDKADEQVRELARVLMTELNNLPRRIGAAVVVELETALVQASPTLRTAIERAIQGTVTQTVANIDQQVQALIPAD